MLRQARDGALFPVTIRWCVEGEEASGPAPRETETDPGFRLQTELGA